MAQRTIDGFILDEAVVVCPECQTPFRTEVLVETRPLNISDIVEADLHRVFTDAALRAAFLSLCPECKYCAWASQFQPFNIRPELVKPQAEIEPARKYALAVKWAREKKIHNLDIAFIALNGLWCAREANEPDALWLELAIFEHEKGMETSTVKAEDDGVTHLIMGELYRQARNFPAAIEQYTLAGTDPSIIKEILDHQRQMCAKGLSHVTALPLRIVRMLFDIVENDGSVSNRNTEDFEDAVFVPAKTVTTTSAKSQAEFANGNMLLSAEALEKIAAVVAAAKAQQAGLVPNINQPALKLVPSNAPAATPASAYAAALAAAAALEAAENPAAAQAQRAMPQGESAGTISQLKTTGPGVFERSSGKPGTQAAIASAAASQVAAKQAKQVQAAGVHSAASAAATGAVPPQRTSASAQGQTVQTQAAQTQAVQGQAAAAAQNVPTEPSAQTEDDGSTPLVAAIAALFSDNSSILAKTDLGTAIDQASPAPAAKASGANLIPDANVPIPQATPKTEPTIKPVAAKAKQSAEPAADNSNVIEIASFDPTAKPETTRPNSAARAAAINARAKSVSAAQNLDPTSANASKRRATRKDRRKQERMPGAQNVRSDHRVTRLPIATAVVNAKGWVTDYGASAQAQAQVQSQAQAQHIPSKVSAPTPIHQTQRSQSSGGSGMELADYEIVGIEEPKAALPDMAIDDPTGYKGEDVPDYTDAISRVENYLSFSRRLYQRNVRGYN